jgi:hypothetical protein
MPRLENAVRGLVANAIAGSREKLEREAREARERARTREREMLEIERERLERLERERLEREARGTPKHPCVICGRSKDTEKQRFQSNRLGGYIHASCAKRTYAHNKARTDGAERATSGEIKGPCALCTEPVTDLDQRVTASDNTTYIHLLCVKKAHKQMEPDDPR